MKRNWYGGIGSVSHATLRLEDLIPSFLWEAKHLRLTKAERKEISRIARESEQEGYYDSKDAVFDLNESLFSILDAHSLPYFRFGAHLGDGSDFGWWLSEDFEYEFDGLRVNDLSEVPQRHTGKVAVINNHGNVTLYNFNRGRRHVVWAIV